jgi:diguanylate cyclase (GGDEF)-like protein
MTVYFLRALSLFAIPAALIGVAFALVFYSGALPPGLSGINVYGPYIAFALGAALAAAFNRGRALLALVVLCGAYGVQQLWLQRGLDAHAARAIYLALVVFVPLNLALLAVLPERGIFNRHGAARLGFVLLQVAIAAWVAAAPQPGLVDWAFQKFLDPAPFSAGRIPQLGAAVVGLGVLSAMAAAVVTRSAISAALAGAIVAFAIAAHVPNAPVTFAAFVFAAELMVTIAVLQDTFRMAFRDELTGIPSRRALNERLAGLGSRYTIAMADVDHFKKFNDTYGHDLGDQVLKMVAARIADVDGGGTAYRYGGEEFTILFPGKEAAEALPYLETLRREVESYQLALRGSDRPKKAKRSKRERGGWRGKNSVSVTISIGVAERNDRLVTPQAVIEAADRALYRAKDKGRNRVSR